MVGKVLNLDDIRTPDLLATKISDRYQEWENLRSQWMEEKRELRNYLFATDTTKTTNATLPWKNKTTLPKLTQIRDNLHANYMAATFPRDEWLEVSTESDDSEDRQKAESAKHYLQTKVLQSGFKLTVEELLLDYIDNGMCFGTVIHVNESKKAEDGSLIQGYVGPKLVRISHHDLVFNPVAASFRDTPKIIRRLITLGELAKEIENDPNKEYLKEIFDELIDVRRKVASQVSLGDSIKSDGFQIDGFSSIQHYYESGFVELLEFRGDLYDIESNELLENHIITIADRTKVLRKEPNPSWQIGDGIFSVGWRLRPDNLYAMGPLDNLVGMQYRIDHLENLKADVFDQIAFPVLKIRGEVSSFNWKPGEKIYIGDDGDVVSLSPDATALNADTQINILEQKMEEFAGAPRMAMGLRTPGEKTAFEVDVLNNGANRIFLKKTQYFEEQFIEPVLNWFLDIGRRNLEGRERVPRITEEGAVEFEDLTRDDIAFDGKLRPVGARNFAFKLRKIQDLINFINIAGSDPSIAPHVSGLKAAELMEEWLDLEGSSLVRENIRIIEQMNTQRLLQTGAEQLETERRTAAGTDADPLTPDEEIGPDTPSSFNAPL